MNARSAYEELARRSRERSLLGSCAELLGWDEQTYMPRGASTYRGEQLALLAGLGHERATDPALDDLLNAVEDSDLVADPISPESANVREWRRAYDRLRELPRGLVEELARATTRGQHDWAAARAGDDFPAFVPALSAVVRLKREEADCLAGGGGGPRYDALLDSYEPGANSAALGALFDALRAELVPLTAAIAGSPRRPDRSILRRAYPVDRQRVFAELVAAAVGFDFDRGRLDTAEHPFCSGIGPGDTRITTRYAPDHFGDAFFGVLHEVGHGLYDQGLDPDHAGTPMGEAVSLGIHESQSRLWENVVGRGRSFWAYWFPIARRVFHDALGGVAFDDFLFAVNEVEPSLIRVQADEVTYDLHVMVRFELERALIAGDLAVVDLPGAWNDAYRASLGVTPADDAEGCLQDIHWAAGLIGYFPTYTLGNLYAAQFFDRATADLGGLDSQFALGDTSALLDWLRRNVHRQGQRRRAADLAAAVTGRPLDHRPLVRRLRQRYGTFYGLD